MLTVTNLRDLRGEWMDDGEETVNIVGLVGNFVFPDHWHRWQSFRHHQPAMVATFGIHPHACSGGKVSPTDLEFLDTVLSAPEVRALGEIGLDYFRHSKLEEQHHQRSSLAQLMSLAVKFEEKPIVIHCRNRSIEDTSAFTDCLTILQRRLSKTSVIHWHCFSGTVEDYHTLKQAFPNTYFGMAGNLLQYSGAQWNSIRLAVSAIPLNRILLESDAPYLLPPRRRALSGSRQQTNHPWTLGDIAEAVASWKGCSVAMILLATRMNAQRVYGPF